MAKSPSLVRSEAKLKKLLKEVTATEKRVKALTAKDAKAAKKVAKKPAKKATKKVAKKVVKKAVKKAAKKTVKKSKKKSA